MPTAQVLPTCWRRWSWPSRLWVPVFPPRQVDSSDCSDSRSIDKVSRGIQLLKALILVEQREQEDLPYEFCLHRRWAKAHILYIEVVNQELINLFAPRCTALFFVVGTSLVGFALVGKWFWEEGRSSRSWTFITKIHTACRPKMYLPSLVNFHFPFTPLNRSEATLAPFPKFCCTSHPP